MTVMPCTPSASIVFRSAWMPAPPPESEPAIARTRGGAGVIHPPYGRVPAPPSAPDGAATSEHLQLPGRGQGLLVSGSLYAKLLPVAALSDPADQRPGVRADRGHGLTGAEGDDPRMRS